MTSRQDSCQNRIAASMESTLTDLRQLWELYCEDSEAYDDDLGHLYEYGLAFDYVAPGTFDDQPEGYFRYQLSWGGPSSEFRIYASQINDWDWSIHRLEYWFLDWFDGAKRYVNGDDRAMMEELITSTFAETGTMTARYNEALEA